MTTGWTVQNNAISDKTEAVPPLRAKGTGIPLGRTRETIVPPKLPRQTGDSAMNQDTVYCTEHQKEEPVEVCKQCTDAMRFRGYKPTTAKTFVFATAEHRANHKHISRYE